MGAESDIVDYYDQCQIDYRLVWHLNSKMAMHYGVWEPGIRRLRDALENTNRMLAHRAGIQPGDHVLDAGCGVGGSSIYLAAKHRAVVTGISLSGKQVSTCEDNARSHGVENRTRFVQTDYTNTGSPPSSYDVVWAIESVCHAADKGAFLREAFRLLRPGGRLVMMDFFRLPSPSGTGDDLVRLWADGWAVPDFIGRDPFVEAARNAGFNPVDTTDITHMIEPSARRLYQLSWPAWPIDFVLRSLRLRDERQSRNARAARWQYLALRKKLWQYLMVCAVKEN